MAARFQTLNQKGVIRAPVEQYGILLAPIAEVREFQKRSTFHLQKVKNFDTADSCFAKSVLAVSSTRSATIWLTDVSAMSDYDPIPPEDHDPEARGSSDIFHVTHNKMKRRCT